jgi:hypothetical protein
MLFAVILLTGCTQNFLKQNTLRTGGSLPDLQTKQVLDNLALLACQPDANPWHLNLASGLIQATDQGNATFTGNVFSHGASSNNMFIPALGAQRALVEQWSVNPVTDGGVLETLGVAYHKALKPQDSGVVNDILDQIVALSVRFTLLPQESTIRSILQYPDPRDQMTEIIKTLDKDEVKLKKRLDETRVYKKRLDDINVKAAYDLAMQIHDLEAKRDLLKDQTKVLNRLADSDPADKRKRSQHRYAFNRPPSPRHAPAGVRRGLEPSETSDTTLLILTALQAKSPPGYLPPTDILWQTTRNPALVDQAEDQIARLEELLEEKFQTDWLHTGCKRDVPHCACYVGHFKGCGQECYVWVMPEDYPTLQKFVRIILDLAAPTAPQDIPARSPAFSPSLR